MGALDLNLNLNHGTDPRTVRLIGLLGNDADIFPIRLWCHIGLHHWEDGRLVGFTDRELAATCGWRSTTYEQVKRFEEAMLEVRFVIKLKGKRGGYQIPKEDWIEKFSHIAKFKRHGKLMAEAKAAKRATSSCTDSSTPPTHPSHPPTQPIHPSNPPNRARGENARGGQGGNGTGGPEHPPNGNIIAALHGAITGNVDEKLEIQRLLSGTGMESANVMKMLGRRDVTAEKVRREIEDIHSDATVQDVARVLYRRLNPKR